MPKFVPRQRKHKVRARLQQQQHRQGDGPDTNASEILPESKTDKQWRKEQLKAELRAQQPAASSKKRKRLDKYIVCGSFQSGNQRPFQDARLIEAVTKTACVCVGL